MRRPALAVACVASLALGSCAAGRSCRAPASAGGLAAPRPATVDELRCMSDRGIALAQLMLGRRYETGDGVPRDVPLAASLYARAAAAVPPSTPIYSPPVTRGGRGQVVFLPNANAGPGLAEAQFRLGRLLIEGEGVPRDPKHGRELMGRSARQGYRLAIEFLQRAPSADPSAP